MPSIVTEEAIKFIFQVLLAGVVAALVARYSKTKTERDDEHASKFAEIIETMATAHGITSEQLLSKVQEVSTLEKHVGKLQADLNELSRQRHDCHKEIAELRRMYSADIERLNGEKDRLTDRLNGLSNEVQKITDPKVKK